MKDTERDTSRLYLLFIVAILIVACIIAALWLGTGPTANLTPPGHSQP